MSNPFNISDLSTDFILAMVISMYCYEAQEVCNSKLLTNAEMEDFYLAYLGVAA